MLLKIAVLKSLILAKKNTKKVIKKELFILLIKLKITNQLPFGAKI